MVYLREFNLTAAFDGTAAASSSWYDLERFRTATPTGGTTLAAQSLRGVPTASLGAALTDIRFLDTGLTKGAATNDEPWFSMGCPRGATGGSVPYDWCGSFEIVPGDGIWIALGVVAVIGDSIAGNMVFEEMST
jgi:hypothetical protein